MLKMKITVKTQTTGYGHPQKKRRGTCEGQDFPASFVFQSQSISKPRLQGIASGTPPPSSRVHLIARKEPSLLGQLYSDLKYPDHPSTQYHTQDNTGGRRRLQNLGIARSLPENPHTTRQLCCTDRTPPPLKPLGSDPESCAHRSTREKFTGVDFSRKARSVQLL